jgi:energy-converting hydrogenase Eha subunit F
MGINIIQGKENKKLKVNQGVVIYVKPDGSVQGELLLNEKVIDTSLFSAIIILSEVDKQWQQI